MVNPTGSNGTDNGVFPPDTELKEILFDYAHRSLRLNLRLRYLERDHQITIGPSIGKFDVPTARKFKAVEEATSAIADIMHVIFHQSQGPDTVKKSLLLDPPNSQLFGSAFVRSAMKGLVGQCPSDMRMPGRGKGPKQRSALNAIGIFQEIHTDGHEKLGEKGSSNGFGNRNRHIWDARPRRKGTLASGRPKFALERHHWTCFLDMVSKYGGMLPSMGGSELGWLAAFQTTLREVFAPDLSAEEWKPVVAVKSTSNIPIESTWSYDRKFNGRSMRDILEEGRIHLIPGDVVHRELFRWLWPKIVQIGLDEPIDELRTLIDTSREEAYRWVSDEFDALASEVYIQLGCPKLEALSGWAIFNAMAPFKLQARDRRPTLSTIAENPIEQPVIEIDAAPSEPAFAAFPFLRRPSPWWSWCTPIRVAVVECSISIILVGAALVDSMLEVAKGNANG
ncbi:hypothetical protein B0H14DRAFT_2567370 [Mycena olivaceomarginata]|nr:hypothetical protein B0H14DRAFT_2567370 [Mycena olivaceomarginata]